MGKKRIAERVRRWLRLTVARGEVVRGDIITKRFGIADRALSTYVSAHNAKARRVGRSEIKTVKGPGGGYFLDTSPLVKGHKLRPRQLTTRKRSKER